METGRVRQTHLRRSTASVPLRRWRWAQCVLGPTGRDSAGAARLSKSTAALAVLEPYAARAGVSFSPHRSSGAHRQHEAGETHALVANGLCQMMRAPRRARPARHPLSQVYCRGSIESPREDFKNRGTKALEPQPQVLGRLVGPPTGARPSALTRDSRRGAAGCARGGALWRRRRSRCCSTRRAARAPWRSGPRLVTRGRGLSVSPCSRQWRVGSDSCTIAGQRSKRVDSILV